MLMQPDIAPERVFGLAQKSRRNATLMSAMVTDLLGFASLQMGARIPVELQATNVVDICEAAAADAHAMYPNSPIVFRHSGKLSGEFDGARLQQLLTNLLINAAQYSDKGSNVQLNAVGQGDAIVLSVANRGPVIPAEALATIFQPLVQLDPDSAADARPRTSLGLGLFIAQETATAHQGTLDVTSSAEEGTVFSARFPRDRKDASKHD